MHSSTWILFVILCFQMFESMFSCLLIDQRIKLPTLHYFQSYYSKNEIQASVGQDFYNFENVGKKK